MPVPPRNPFGKFTCKSCGWSKVTYQNSDVILPLSACAKCGGDNLKLTPANAVESALALPVEYALHWLK